MEELSKTSKEMLLSEKTPKFLSRDLIEAVSGSYDKNKLKLIDNLINFYSYRECHVLTYWFSNELPELKVAVFYGKSSGRPTHSAIALPSGFIFDAQGIREKKSVFDMYNQLTLEHRNEEILPAKIINREQLIENMIEISKSFNTRADVEESFNQRKSKVLSVFNDLLEIASKHVFQPK